MMVLLRYRIVILRLLLFDGIDGIATINIIFSM
jgi:hypothetical protein